MEVEEVEVEYDGEIEYYDEEEEDEI